MIPKIIHYCWFGGNPKPKLAEKCIKSWKTYCPDYEIIEWNENSFDIAGAPLYVRQAYEAKKWAFVTDYVRLYAMVNYGGIYMDTDVELIGSLDRFLDNRAFSGFENERDIPTGIMASEKDFPMFLDLLHYYDSAAFVKEDGSYDLTTNVSTITAYCLEKGLVQNNTFQIVDGFSLYPNDVFCPLDLDTRKVKRTNNTVAIHWFSGSWVSPEEKKKAEKELKANRRMEIKASTHNAVKRIIGEKAYSRLKEIAKR